MLVQKLAFPFFLALVTDTAALFYFAKDHQQQQSHEEVDHHNHHHYDEPKYQNHKYQGHKHQEEHKHHEHKQEKKPQQMHKHHEHDHHHHYHHHHHHGHEHKHQEEHKHHEHKHHEDHKHHDHKHHDDHKHHEHKHHEHGHHDHKHHEHYQEHKHQGQPHYEFKYGVRDPNTGDIKNQWEVRKGDSVLGEYSLVEADGTIRTVQYTAGKHTGFNAIVKKEGKAQHPMDHTGQKIQSPKQTHRPAKIFRPEPINVYELKPKTGYADVDTSRVPYALSPSDLPTNHKPVFSGIDEETNLLALYKHYPVYNFHRNEGQPFDYGMKEYLYKRSYDLNKITELLNSSPSVDPMRAARGGFIMGR